LPFFCLANSVLSSRWYYAVNCLRYACHVPYSTHAFCLANIQISLVVLLLLALANRCFVESHVLFPLPRNYSLLSYFVVPTWARHRAALLSFSQPYGICPINAVGCLVVIFPVASFCIEVCVYCLVSTLLGCSHSGLDARLFTLQFSRLRCFVIIWPRKYCSNIFLSPGVYFLQGYGTAILVFSYAAQS
jgi:hypothetical protein